MIDLVGALLRSLLFLLWYLKTKKEEKAISKNLDNKNRPLANEDIKAEFVLVIGEDGQNFGQMRLEDALKAANERELDLVCVAPNAKVPVCRFTDYQKFCYDMQRRAKESKKNQKIVVVKELRVTPVIGENDFAVKVKNCREFLADGHKVKITLYYPRGKRRLLQMESSSKVLDRFVEELDDVATVEATTKVEGRVTAVSFGPKKIKK